MFNLELNYSTIGRFSVTRIVLLLHEKGVVLEQDLAPIVYMGQ